MFEVFEFWYYRNGRVWKATKGFADFDPETRQLSNYTLFSATEYRYDETGRQRYHVLLMEPAASPPGDRGAWQTSDNGAWIDYLGDDLWQEYAVNVANGATTNTRHYAPGVAYAQDSAGQVQYVHNDQIGTVRRMTNSPASGPAAVVHRNVKTAFGERVYEVYSAGGISPGPYRFIFAGAWGYGEGGSGDPMTELGWVHVGERYYDPSLGRFVQRDPIGISGGLNTYLYGVASPLSRVDPNGLSSNKGRFWRIAGSVCGAIGSALLIDRAASWYYQTVQEGLEKWVRANGVEMIIWRDASGQTPLFLRRPYRVPAESLPKNDTANIESVMYILLDDGRVSIIVRYQDGTVVQLYGIRTWNERGLDPKMP